jgi:hypothetical protein
VTALVLTYIYLVAREKNDVPEVLYHVVKISGKGKHMNKT